MKLKIDITRKPKPPTLDPFDCILCGESIKRDPWNPDWQKPPVCIQCQFSGHSRFKWGALPIQYWSDLRRAEVLIYAIEKEIRHARQSHQHR